MAGSYAVQVGKGFHADPKKLVMPSIFQQYESVLVESLITSFGLEFLVQDQYGGDVDTIHNVRKIGQDDQMTYKNVLNQQTYEQQKPYDKSQYDSDDAFKVKRAEYSRQKEDGTLVDAYTGQTVAGNANIDVDHVIATKLIHDDRGRVLSGLKGVDLANSEENLQPTDRSINRSKQNKSVDEYCEWLEQRGSKRAKELERLRSKPQSELTDEERNSLHKYEQQESIDQEKMKKVDATARKAYNTKIARAYYTSPQFAEDVAKAAGNVSVHMGTRQALGLVFAEMWFAVKEEFQKSRKDPFSLGDFLKALGNGLKRGFQQVKVKYKELFSRFLDGAVAGALSSLTTTLCNIFFTTAKNTVRIIRQSYASLVEAGKILLINPKNYTFGERMQAVAKILATGASVIVGVIVSDAIGNTGIKGIPVLGDTVPSFCGAFVSGIMSCTLLYFLERSEIMNRLFKVLDRIHTIDTDIQYYREQADYFERYAAELAKIDLDQFRKEIKFYGQITEKLESAETEEELNRVLKDALKEARILIPWDGYESFGQFMMDKNAHLIFE